MRSESDPLGRMGVIETLQKRMRWGRAACYLAGVETAGVVAGLATEEMDVSLFLAGAAALWSLGEVGNNIYLNRYEPANSHMFGRFTRRFVRDIQP